MQEQSILNGRNHNDGKLQDIGKPTQTRADSAGETIKFKCVTMMLVLIFVLATVYRSFTRYSGFGMGIDIAIFSQACWQISHFHEPNVTIRGMHLLGDHFSLAVYGMSAIFSLAPSPKTLLVCQSVALGVGAFPVFSIARHFGLNAHASCLAAAVYLTFPPVIYCATGEFYPDILAVPLMLATFQAALAGRLPRLIFFAVILCTTKEVAGVSIIFLGIAASLYKLKSDNRLIVIGAGATLVALLTMRVFNNNQGSQYFALFSRFGTTTNSVVLGLIQHPVLALRAIVNPEMAHYVVQLTLPTMFVCILGWRALVASVPALIINALSDRPQMRNISCHYTAYVIPGIVAAALDGVSRIPHFSMFNGVRQSFVLSGIVLWCVISGPICAPPSVNQHLSANEATRLNALLSKIPASASVSSDPPMLPAVSCRQHAFLFPNPFIRSQFGSGKEAQMQLDHGDDRDCTQQQFNSGSRISGTEYVLLGRELNSETRMTRTSSLCLLKCPDYGIVGMSHFAILLRRGASHAQGLNELGNATGMIILNDKQISNAYDVWATTRIAYQ